MKEYKCFYCDYTLLLIKTDLEDTTLMCPMCLLKLKVKE